MPVIALVRDTTKEAVCVVFEKVNTGGKPLDAFELVTAMYAAAATNCGRTGTGTMDEGPPPHALPRRSGRAARKSVFSPRSRNTDFLQAVSLFHTRDRRRAAESRGKQGRNCPPSRATGRRC